MSVSTQLLADNRDLWAAITDHPFVRAAGNGTLRSDAFHRWLTQDQWFVVGFRRFLGRLVELAPNEHARDLLAGAFPALQAEIDLFRREAAQHGLPLDVEPSPTTLGYTSLVLAAPVDGWPVSLTVLYGAERAYFDAWASVRGSADERSPYWPFIDNWSSPAFGEWVDRLAALLDATVTAPAPPEVERAFRRVVRFELRFWDAVHAGESWEDTPR
ncbi:MAG: transcriptional regulator [Actinomycetota bacterium]|nr:transcriptional regulator [Actinomycetota bacterium]